jgi:quercetin dioxygenase-like cupin family protein
MEPNGGKEGRRSGEGCDFLAVAAIISGALARGLTAPTQRTTVKDCAVPSPRALTDCAVHAYFPGMGDTDARLTVMVRTGSGGAGLVCTLAELPPGGLHTGTGGIGGELWFVVEGSGRVDLDGLPGPHLVPDRGLRIPAGAAYQVESGQGGPLRLDIVALQSESGSAAGAARSPAVRADVPLSRDLRDCAVATTGDRKFRVLFGPGRDCEAATQFVGEIPPGRAPEHSHPYDEVVLVLQGTGVAHVGGADHQLSAGTWVHLPPGLVHCLENIGPQTMRVLGVFHPAGSPAAKLRQLPSGRVPVRHRRDL